MGKKKKKKSRKAKKYSKSQFVGIVCRHCSLCEGYPDPTFCYQKMYRKGPEIFMDDCYLQLLNMSAFSFVPTISEFRKIFCHSGVCGDKHMVCEDILLCHELFKDQIERGIDALYAGKKKGKKLKDDPYIFEAYPTLFLSGNKEWKDEVEGILKNED